MSMIERASKYVAAMPAAISGSGGHAACFAVAVALIHGFGLSEDDAWPILLEYNGRCEPPWNERELRHKLTSAGALSRHPKPRGHLRGSGETVAPLACGEVRVRKVRWQDMVAEVAGGNSASFGDTSRGQGPSAVTPPDWQSLIGTAQRMFKAEILPDDDLDPDMRERLAMIDAILGQRGARGRTDYTASQIEACASGLRQHAGTHPEIDAMLHRLNEEQAMALGWRDLVKRWRG